MRKKTWKRRLTDLYTSTGLVVWLTVFLMMSMLPLQFVLNKVQTIPNLLPLETMAWVLTVVVSGYVGTDRIANFKKTQSLSYGQADFGNMAKLRKMIIILFIIIIEALLFYALFGVGNAPVSTLILAYGGAAGTYVIGNKAIRAATHTNGEFTVDPNFSILPATSEPLQPKSTIAPDSIIPKPPTPVIDKTPQEPVIDKIPQEPDLDIRGNR